MDLSLFGIGFPQILLIMVVALLVFGPEKLPEMARQAGRMVGQFRAWMQDARNELKTITEVQEEFKTIKEDLATIRKDLTETSQEMLKELEDVRKEVDIRSDVTEALSDKPLEQYTYQVKETEPAELVAETAMAENDAKMVALVEDALNDAHTEALATGNGYKTSLGTIPAAVLATGTPEISSSDRVQVLQTQIESLTASHERFQKDFSVLVQHISELTQRLAAIEQNSSVRAVVGDDQQKTLEMI